MGEWTFDVGATMGTLLCATGYLEVSHWSGASGLHARVAENRPSGRRIEVRHKSLTISGQIRGIERASVEELEDLDLWPRPPSRGECRSLPRPCPYVSCTHHLYIEVNPVTGSVQFPFGALGIDEIPHTCSLDAAEDGPLTLEEIGRLTNRTKERVRQLETRGLVLLRGYGVSPSMLNATMADWLDEG